MNLVVKFWNDSNIVGRCDLLSLAAAMTVVLVTLLEALVVGGMFPLVLLQASLARGGWQVCTTNSTAITIFTLVLVRNSGKADAR